MLSLQVILRGHRLLLLIRASVGVRLHLGLRCAFQLLLVIFIMLKLELAPYLGLVLADALQDWNGCAVRPHASPLHSLDDAFVEFGG